MDLGVAESAAEQSDQRARFIVPQGKMWLMTGVRQVTAVLGGIWAGLWLGRAAAWLFGLHGRALVIAFVVGGVLGCIAGVDSARDLKPWDAGERRDAAIGWSVVVALVLIGGLVVLLGG